VSVHGLVYSIEDGILRDLGVNLNQLNQLPPIYRMSRKPEPGAFPAKPGE